MRTPLLLAVLGAALVACGGSVTGGGANPAGAGPGEPHDVASVRLFDSTGGEGPRPGACRGEGGRGSYVSVANR